MSGLSSGKIGSNKEAEATQHGVASDDDIFDLK